MEAWHLKCPHCGKVHRANLVDLIGRLRRLGMLLRESAPEPEFVASLAREATHRMECDDCGATGLVRTAAPDDFDTPQGKSCVACGERIPPERVELFPACERCAACQSALDRGEPTGNDREFCPRCGEVMRIRVRQGAVAAYQMYCPGCGATT